METETITTTVTTITTENNIGRVRGGMTEMRMGPMMVPGQGVVGIAGVLPPAVGVDGGAVGMRPGPALGAAAAAAAAAATIGTGVGAGGGAALVGSAGGSSAPLESQSVGDVLKLLTPEMQEKIRHTLIACLEEHESVSRIERVAKESARKQFFKAIYDRDYDLVYLLLCGSRSTYINANLICPEDRWPALHACLYKYNQYPPEETIKIVKLLLDKGADISKPCPEGAVAINVLDKKPLPNGSANGPDNPKREKKTVSFQNKQVVDVAIDFLQAYKWAGCRQTVLNNWKPLIELLDEASMQQRQENEHCFHLKYSIAEPSTVPVDAKYATKFLKMLESGSGSDCTITCTYQNPNPSTDLSLAMISVQSGAGLAGASGSGKDGDSISRSIDDDEDMDDSRGIRSGVAMTSSSDVVMSVGLSGGIASGSVPELSGKSGTSLMELDSFGDESKSSGVVSMIGGSSEITGLDEPSFGSGSSAAGGPGFGMKSGSGFFCTTTSSMTESGIIWKTSFSVHRSILMANSPVFEHMFQHEMVESISSEVLMSDTPPDAVRIMIYFMYSGRLNEELLLMPDSVDDSSVAGQHGAIDGSGMASAASGSDSMPTEETRDEEFDSDHDAADPAGSTSAMTESRADDDASDDIDDQNDSDPSTDKVRRSNIGLALSALCLAEKYGMDELKLHLEYHLHSRIDKSNSLEVLTAAHTHNAAQLRRVALSYVCDHFAQLSKESSFAVFSKQYPSLLQQVLEIVTKECMRTTPGVGASHSSYRVLSKGASAYAGLPFV